jgi:hypothetical protein
MEYAAKQCWTASAESALHVAPQVSETQKVMDINEAKQHFTEVAKNNARCRKSSTWLYWTDIRGKEFYVTATDKGRTVEYTKA